MGNVINSIVFFQLTDYYKEAEIKLDNYFLMKENINEQEINDMILTVKNDIEYDKLKKRFEKINEEKQKNEEEEADEDNNNDNSNFSLIKKVVKKPNIILQ